MTTQTCKHGNGTKTSTTEEPLHEQLNRISVDASAWVEDVKGSLLLLRHLSCGDEFGDEIKLEPIANMAADRLNQVLDLLGELERTAMAVAAESQKGA